MKILAFVDVHASMTALKKLEEKVKKHKPDVIVCAGDISIFENDIEVLMNKVSKLGKKILIIPGNHETPAVLKKLCSFYENIIYINKKIIRINDIYFIGFAGEGFSRTDSELEEFGKKIKHEIKDKKIVFVTHAPPYKTKLDMIGKEHCGNKTVTNFIKSNPNIVLHVCGHFHETSGNEDRIGSTRTINPGPWGRIIEI
ncbi:MAG: metallophosphoesterase [Candidatus Woesearchaeota archaeon]